MAFGEGTLLQMMRTLPNGSVHKGVVEVPVDRGIPAGRNAGVQHSRCVVLEEERVRIGCRGQRIELVGPCPDLVRSLAHPRQPMPYAERYGAIGGPPIGRQQGDLVRVPLYRPGQLVIGGVHEMSEQRFLPFIEQVHAATESWGPDSAFGHLLSYLLVILPLGWLAIKAVFSKRPVLLPKKPSAPSLPDASSVAPRTQSALQ